MGTPERLVDEPMATGRSGALHARDRLAHRCQNAAADDLQLAERVWAAGFGLGGVLMPTGLGTLLKRTRLFQEFQLPA